jgi:hypothetical protein
LYEYAAPCQHHICQVDLVFGEDRQGFFHFSDVKGRHFKMPDVIPAPEMQRLHGKKMGSQQIAGAEAKSRAAWFYDRQ